MDDIRTAALAAVAEVTRDVSGTPSVIHATKIVYDKLGCSLVDARDAVRWAIDHPGASSLPFESVVAGRGCVFIKLDKAGEPTLPWRGTTDGMYVNQYGDAEITDMIQRGEATILRVGAGAS